MIVRANLACPPQEGVRPTNHMSSNPLFIVLSGSSGSGKTTLSRLLAQRLRLYFGISHTTRKKRLNETEGVDYYFVTPKEFENMVHRGEFLEWATVYDHCYGTSKIPIEACLEKGQGVVVDVDPVGALNIKKAYPGALLVFIKAPSEEVLQKRLAQRGKESEEEKAKRLAQVKVEEKYEKHYDHVLVNNVLQATYEELEKIIKLHHHEL